MQAILSDLRHAYYIVTPRYVRTSAGIKATHMLCHALNRQGERAYIVLHPHWPGPEVCNTDWLTPLITPEIIRADFDRGLTPIVVYGETIRGNLLDAPVVVRYLLNYPGLLGGDRDFAPTEIQIAYSQRIADSTAAKPPVLFIPASDTTIFKPEPRGERHGSCFYAAKYQHFHHGTLFPITRHSVEITRDLPDSQTPSEIAELFRRSELFYCYENSALIIEALLCECPVVMLPNPHLTHSIGEHELGWDGIAWGATPEEVARAKATVHDARLRYDRLYEQFWVQLDHFISLTQSRAAATPYTTAITIQPVDRRSSILLVLSGVAHWFSDAFRMLDHVVRERGWFSATREVMVWIARRGLRLSDHSNGR